MSNYSHKSLPILGLTIISLFFLSGMTGLIYEVIWIRMLTSVFGNTTYATSAVITAFMGGLALGSFVIGRFADRKQHLLKIYASLELGIGLTALSLPLLLDALNKFYAVFYQGLHYSNLQIMIIKTVMSFVILLVPTFLMGGTLPVLSKFFIRSTEQSGRRVGLLYGVNTLGATVGCFLAGFLFIEALGITKTIQFTAAINIFLAVVLFLISVFLDSGKRIEMKKRIIDRQSRGSNLQSRYAILIITGFALAGFVSLSFEILWTRLLVFELHTTVYAFAIMLTTFLAGIGLGSLIFTLIDKYNVIKNHYKAFGVIESLIGVIGLVSIFLFGNFESIVSPWSAVSWGELIARKLCLAALIMIVPTVLMGIAFPLVSRIYTRNIKKVGTSIGTIYSVNTVGGIFGAFLTGFLIVKIMGTQNSIILVSLIALIVGTLILVLRPVDSAESKTSRGISIAFISLLWIIAVAFISWIPEDFLYRYYNIAEKEVNSRVEILYAHEGVEGITTVHRYPDGNWVISTGSINVAGTDFTLRTTQKLQAHIPMLLHPNPEEVLQVGFGSGETSYILTTYETKRVDVVEISRGVLKTGAQYFRDLNHDILHNPKFHPIIMDGANYIALTECKYDVIMNDAIWPFYSGNSGLYTKEYFEDCKLHLKDGGIMTSWLPVELPEESFKTLLKTFHSVFPYVSLWMAVTHYNKHALIVGALRPINIDIDLFLKRFDQFARDDLRSINLDDPIFFLNAFKMDEAGFAEWVNSAPLNTLDKPVLEFAPRKRRPGVDRVRSYELITKSSISVMSHLTNLGSLKSNGIDFVNSLKAARAATKHVMFGLVMREKGQGNFLKEFERALELKPAHPGARYLIDKIEHLKSMDSLEFRSATFKDLIRTGEVFFKNGIYKKAIVAFRRAADLKPSSALAHYNIGRTYYRQGLLDKSLEELNKALRLKPNYAQAYYERGLIYYSKSNYDKAISNFSKAIALTPDYAIAYNSRGIAYTSKGESRKALDDFYKAISLSPDYAKAYYNRGLLYQSNYRYLGYTKDKGFDRAISDYSRAISLDSLYINAYNNRGMLYALRENYRLAIDDFNKAIELNPDQADAYYNRGLAYRLWGNYDKAKKDFKKAVILNPEYKKMLDVEMQEEMSR